MASDLDRLGSYLPPTENGGMRVPDLSQATKLLDATIFLYGSYQDAETGSEFGGSGVIILAPLPERPDLGVPYAVTNWHVACRGSSVIRFIDQNTRKPVIIDKDPSEWLFIPGKQDVAVTPLSPLNGAKPVCLPMDMLITQDDEGGVFVGDDVFMAGRFLDYDGKETNEPALRFGAVSLLNAQVKQATGWMGRSIVADMRSRTGFSGSPVYVCRPGGFNSAPGGVSMHIGLQSEPSAPSRRTWGMGNDTVIRMLGIQWGQFPEQWELKDGAIPQAESAEASLVTEGKYVRGLSGMSCVCPADQIIDVLNLPELVAERAEAGLATNHPIAGV